LGFVGLFAGSSVLVDFKEVYSLAAFYLCSGSEVKNITLL
jgi:hypothetical protein